MIFDRKYKKNRLVIKSKIFDTAYYQNRYRNQLAIGKDPLQDFLQRGMRAKLNPSPLFDSVWYEEQYMQPNCHLTPFEHYLLEGVKERYSPHPLFNANWYLETYQDVAASNVDPLGHYIEYGAAEGRNPNKFFWTDWYKENYIEVQQSNMNPLSHFIEFGEIQRYTPSPLFDVNWYNSQFEDDEFRSLSHFLAEGIRTGLKPSRPVVFPNSESPINEDQEVHANFDAVPVCWAEPRMVIVDATYPTPDRDSGSIDAVNFISLFQRIGYKVYFAATANFYKKDLDLISNRARIGLEASGVIVLDDSYGESLKEVVRLNGGYFRFYFLSRFDCGGDLYECIRAHTPKSKIIFNTVDLHSLRILRQAKLTDDKKSRSYAYRVAEREYYLSRLSDATIVVSSEEAKILAAAVPGAPIHTVPLIREIPGRTKTFNERKNILFVGSYDHSPNLDAVEYFLADIWPLVFKRMPDVSFVVVGSKMPDRLLSRTDPGLVILGHVENLSEIFENIKLSVAPLRYGAGAKGKVVTSLGYGVPCIASSIAAEGMGVGENSTVLINDDAHQFAACVVDIYTNESLWQSMSDKGLAKMYQVYSLDVGYRNIESLIKKVGLDSDWPN